MNSKPPLRVVDAGNSTGSRKWLRILIADDDRDNAHILAMLLTEEGHEVHVRLRGDDALEVCRLLRPDVVITDVNMPGLSGYALAHELRERHGELAPLLIGISGVWTQPADRVLGKEVGFDHYLLKPCDPQEVIRLIEPLRSGKPVDGAASA